LVEASILAGETVMSSLIFFQGQNDHRRIAKLLLKNGINVPWNVGRHFDKI
jgi:hypothetical protein